MQNGGKFGRKTAFKRQLITICSQRKVGLIPAIGINAFWYKLKTTGLESLVFLLARPMRI